MFVDFDGSCMLTGTSRLTPLPLYRVAIAFVRCAWIDPSATTRQNNRYDNSSGKET